MRSVASLLFLGFASVASAQTVSLTVNTSQTASISPYIYGIDGTISSGGFNNLTLTRAGRQLLDRLPDWTNNYSNAGSDYYYENDNYLDSQHRARHAVTASTVQNSVSPNNAASLLTASPWPVTSRRTTSARIGTRA